MSESHQVVTTNGGVPRLDHSLRPLLLDAAESHRSGAVSYADDGTATVRHPAYLASLPDGLTFPPARQFPAIKATFDDLNKTISRLSNSPLMGTRTLREIYELEAASYEQAVMACEASGGWEPDYGTYVVDRAGFALYLVAPERWHRLALVTSNAKLLTDPEGHLGWAQLRARLEGTVIGFAGVSVGGNVVEGWLREARPRAVKIADPDWVEVTNFNRGERMSLRHAVASRGARFDRRSPWEQPRVSKAEYVTYEQQLVDPYLRGYVYAEGLTRGNIDAFLLGGAGEPRIDVLVEETDDFAFKIAIRQAARRHGIDVLMMTDFGHRAHVLWNAFAQGGALGAGADQAALEKAVDGLRAGDRSQIMHFVDGLCGAGHGVDEFGAFLAGQGEQPTSSTPQSGATAMASGAIGGKELALWALGRRPARTHGFAYDLKHRLTTPEVP